jgi:predicted Zn finger-like uncharacterized protein
MALNFIQWLKINESSDEYTPDRLKKALDALRNISSGKKADDPVTQESPSEKNEYTPDRLKKALDALRGTSKPYVEPSEIKPIPPEAPIRQPEGPSKHKPLPPEVRHERKQITCPYCKSKYSIEKMNFALGSKIKCPNCDNTFGRGEEDGSIFISIPMKQEEIGQMGLRELIELIISNKFDSSKAKGYFLYWKNSIGPRYNESDPEKKAKELESIAWMILGSGNLGIDFWNFVKERIKANYPKIIAAYDKLDGTYENKQKKEPPNSFDLELNLD